MKNGLLRYGLLTVLASLLTAPLAQAQAPNWQAASAFANNVTLKATTADASGNVYLVGTFTGVVTFGSSVLTSAGGSDIFVAKWNPANGSYAWAKRAGSADAEDASSVAISGSSVYVAGYFSGATITFGGSTLTNTGSGSSADAFVAKLTDAGGSTDFSWAQRAGGTGSESFTAMAVSGTNVYMIGKYTSPTLTLGGSTLTNAGNLLNGELFVAKLNDAGVASNFVWGQRVGAASNGTSFAPDFSYTPVLAVSGSNVYIAGSFVGAVTFGSTVLNNAGNPAVYQNIFVAKLADAGPSASFVWAKQNANTGGGSAYAIAASGSAVYVAGAFYSPTFSLGGILLTNNNTNSLNITGDAYVAKLTDAGSSSSFAWAQSMGGVSEDAAYGLVSQGPDIYVTGQFRSHVASFGNTTLTNATSIANDDIFVAKITDFGTFLDVAWAQQGGGPDYDYATSIAVSGGSVFASGIFRQSASFGNYTLTAPANTSSFFLATLAAAPLATRSSAASDVQLFPNPAHDRATVQLPAGTGAATLTILDALGRTVRTQVATANSKAELDLTGLVPGLYAVRVAAGGSAATQRLVVE